MTATHHPTAAQVEILRHRMMDARRAGKLVQPIHDPETLDAYPVTYPYGVKSDAYAAGHHTGEDHACPVGSLACAVTWGEVIAVGEHTGYGADYGQIVVIRQRNGEHDYFYAHLSQVLVHPGTLVHPGLIVGLTGNSGNSTGPHCHFEARPAGGRYGSDVNPNEVKRAKSKGAGQ